ncbi:restriction endonuclease subunit S [Lactobacillus mulieris]|uniref:restriction endonuclease subunit S n=2 Tax=Lactobacillus mulieris TaxID=2508708 RepID=UPI00084E9B04|nr:restriction endonuclease subunit S [Lactobacillus mulieris]KAA9243863.1 restriction endonuclease subunit S [Lactobacillus jensenii]KAA9366249.1 restriction endonuclease subunit S [Lactobacillus jensenii]MCW8073642.1 restriction endonuclease subunit S [Lactobacillus mulieris]MCW8106783.1 restriction endonuclease subunit S [Lactobacillus mulieris]MCW8124216.1 restriction endonuclease subunit S [Lactobacillus mulieris]
MYPKVRFRGFDEPWKKVKLGDVAEIIGGGTPSTSNLEYWDGNINWFTPTEVGKTIYLHESQRKLSELGLKKSSARLLNPGAILFTSRAGIGNTGIIINPSATNQGFQSIQPNKNIIDSYFIFCLSSRLKRYALKHSAGSTFTEISGSEMKKAKIRICAKNEQNKISTCIKSLDSLLSLQQRKLELENQLKQFNLQNLFSDEQRLYPKVRFRGFDEPWKKVKLGRNVKRIRRKNKNLETNIPLTISAQFGLVDQRDFFGRVVASENLANYILLKRGEFAYNKSYSKEAPYGSIKRLEKYNEGALSTLYIAFTPENINSDFLKAFFDTTKWYSHIVQVSTEGARNHGLLNISPQDFFEMSITIPKSDEQNNISRIYNLMNSLLSLQQQDINTTQQLKQFLLQNLFI